MFQLKFKEEGLSPLNLFDEIKVEDIKEAIKKDIEAKHLGYLIKNDDPLYSTICVFSYREMLLRQRINNIAQIFCNKLEGINNTKYEPCGLTSYYAQSSIKDSEVEDAVVEKKEGGLILVHLLVKLKKKTDKDKRSEEKRLEAVRKRLEAVRKRVEDHLNQDDQKILGDTIECKIVKPTIKKLEVEIVPEKDAVIDINSLKKRLSDEIRKKNRIGQNFYESWITSKLHQKGVSHVRLAKALPRIAFNEILDLEVQVV